VVQEEDMPILVGGEIEEDLIEVNDDGLLDVESRTLVTPNSTAPTRSYRTGTMPLLTMGVGQQHLIVTPDAQLNIFKSY